tara:strand:+ start:1697 stop:2152 length:456 start_codon:yes stop_codon:yes gene_type:complete
MNPLLRTYQGRYYNNHINDIIDINFNTIICDDLQWEWEEIIIPEKYTYRNTEHTFKKKYINIPRLSRHPLQAMDCTAERHAYIDFINSPNIKQFRMKKDKYSELDFLRKEFFKNKKKITLSPVKKYDDNYDYDDHTLSISDSTGLSAYSYE